MTEIIYYRNDTKPIRVLVRDKDSLTPVDITGRDALLTVDPAEDPTDALNNLVQIVGVIEDGINGKVLFTPSGSDMDFAPGSYYFDVQLADPGGTNRTTVVKGTFTHLQDITK